MEDKQLQNLKLHNATLCQFIVKLSVFYEGFSDKIDDELKVLRGHLSGKPNFSLATVSIEKLNTLLQRQDVTLRKYSTDTTSSLEDAMKQLQKIVFEDEELKGLTTQELIKLNQPIRDVFSIYKLYAKAIALHRIALNKRMTNVDHSESAVLSPTESDKSSENQKTDTTDKQAYYNSILSELNQLIATYAQKKPNDSQLKDIKSRLDQGVDEDQLLKSCVIILRMIVQDAMSEASFTGKVIQSLHNSLGKISDNVDKSIKGSQAQYEQRKVGTEQLKSQIDTIEEAVTTSDSLDSLKAHTQSCVKNLVSTLNEQQSNDEQSQEALMALLYSMQEQINTLEQQTSAYKKKLAEQATLSRTDTLTRLPNRQTYNENLNSAFERFNTSGEVFAVAIMDIDHFKSINDRFGHAAGDKTLQAVARFLHKNIEKNEFVARWGGEEFVLLISNATIENVSIKLDELRAQLAKMPFKFKQEKVKITASFGATCITSEDGSDSVFNRADEYLYEAKRNGRNRVITDLNAKK